jgi:hypothetical protein
MKEEGGRLKDSSSFVLLPSSFFLLPFFSPARFFSTSAAEVAVVVAAAATATTTTVAAASATTASAAKAPFGLRTRFVHDQCSTIHLVLVQLADCLLRVIVGCHLHERKPARTPGRHVPHDADVVDLPGAAEQFGELIFGG